MLNPNVLPKNPTWPANVFSLVLPPKENLEISPLFLDYLLELIREYFLEFQAIDTLEKSAVTNDRS